MKCIIIVNTLSGHYKKRAIYKKIEELSNGFETSFVYLDENTPFPTIKDFERVVVFGGDGTLNSFLNVEKSCKQELIYVPIGTLNEVAKNSKYSFDQCLSVNGKSVAYVFACGIFTPLGYNTKIRSKKRLKVFAYILNVLKEYKIARIKASITLKHENKDATFNNYEQNENISTQKKNLSLDPLSAKEEYSLIMCIKSKTCFGFKFNKLKNEADEFEFLSIKAPKHSGLFGKIELFFPLFPCFFIGFKKDYSSKNITFKKVTEVSITLDEKTAFCLDGEKAVYENNIFVNTKSIQEIKIITNK